MAAVSRVRSVERAGLLGAGRASNRTIGHAIKLDHDRDYRLWPDVILIPGDSAPCAAPLDLQ
jgi:hypothetical protein